MKRHLPLLAALILLPAITVLGQDLAGDWQGALQIGPQQLRLVLQISKAASGWKATMYSIDQSTNPIPVTSVSLEGAAVKFTVAAVRGSYDGKISADGNSMTGTWTQGSPLPLELRRATKETAWPIDSSSHSIQFVTVDRDVKLEVLDWGGVGRPLVLLTGLGDNAHVYDRFAPKLTASYHVYGITRRGFGASSHPDSGYAADRLGDDVLAVLDALKLYRPVLAGHSIAGEELSSIGSRYPEKVAGMVYLDAGYAYAYYDRSRGDLRVDAADLKKELDRLSMASRPDDMEALIRELLETGLPGLERDLRQSQQALQAMPPAMRAIQQNAPPQGPVAQAILAGGQKYTRIPVPILAIYAVPHEFGPAIERDAAARAAFEAQDEKTTGVQAKAFESGVPTAHVVRIPRANHYVFRSNEADVLREMNAFIAGLPR